MMHHTSFSPLSAPARCLRTPSPLHISAHSYTRSTDHLVWNPTSVPSETHLKRCSWYTGTISSHPQWRYLLPSAPCEPVSTLLDDSIETGWKRPRPYTAKRTVKQWAYRHCLPLSLVLLMCIIALICTAVVLTLKSQKRAPQPVNEHSTAPLDARFTEISTGIQGAGDARPAFLRVGEAWYAFTLNLSPETHNSSDNVAIATSSDFAHWTALSGDALPRLGDWAAEPSSSPNATSRRPVLDTAIMAHPSQDLYVLYYTAPTAADPSKHCIGAATAASPEGPYTPLVRPLACPPDGACRPTPMVDADGTMYLLYTTNGDGDACTRGGRGDARVVLQGLADDGSTPYGVASTVLVEGVEGGVRAPTMVKHEDGSYVLVYTTGCQGEEGHGVAYATGADVGGPFEARGILVTVEYGFERLGAGTVIRKGDGWTVVFGASVAHGKSGLFAAKLTIDDGKVSVRKT